jgi:hypothetical protein
MVLQLFLPDFAHNVGPDVPVRVGGGASRGVGASVAGCADGGADNVGEPRGDDEAKRDVGGDSLSSAHLKYEQLVPFSCFL